PVRRGARRRFARGMAGVSLDHLKAGLTEDLGREVFAIGFQPGKQLGHDAGPAERAEDIALIIDAGLVEETDVLQLNLVAIDAGDLGDMRHDATPVAQTSLLDQQGDAADDLFADGLEGQIGTTHDDHGLDPVDRVLWAVGVHGCHAAVVAGVHRLEHVERFGGAAFADDDPVGPHPQGVDDQVPDGDGAATFHVRAAGFQGDQVALAELQLGGIFDGYDALGVRNEVGQHVECRGLARTGAAADHHADPRPNTGANEVRHVVIQRPEIDEVLDLVWHTRKFPDGDARALHGQWGNHDIHPRAIGKTGVDHGRGLIDPPANPRDDPIDDLAELAFVLENQIGLPDATSAFGEDRLRPIDHDLADLGVFQQGFQWTQAKDVMQDQLGELGPVVLGQLELGLVAVLVGELCDAALDHIAADRVRILTEGRDQAFMNGPLDGVNIRDARGDVLRLDHQARETRHRRGLALLRLLRKLAFVEFVNEQHRVLLVSSATRAVPGSVACAGPPAYPPVSPSLGRTADTGASLSVSKTCVPVDSGTGWAAGRSRAG